MSAPSLFDAVPADVMSVFPGPSHRDDPITSHQAAMRNAPRAGSQRARCLDALDGAGWDGLTDFELSVRCGMARPHVAGNRRLELQRLGLCEPTDMRRDTDCGSPAVVHRITDVGQWVADELRRAEQS